MKIKKIMLLRLELEIEFHRPILGRLYLFFKFPTLCKVFKKKLWIKHDVKFGYADCGRVFFKNIYFICIPKIKVVKSE